jgi:hypothetical protein
MRISLLRRAVECSVLLLSLRDKFLMHTLSVLGVSLQLASLLGSFLASSALVLNLILAFL